MWHMTVYPFNCDAAHQKGVSCGSYMCLISLICQWSMLAMFFVVLLIAFLEQVFQKIWVLSTKVDISLIVHNQNINKGHRLALTNIIMMKWGTCSFLKVPLSMSCITIVQKLILVWWLQWSTFINPSFIHSHSQRQNKGRVYIPLLVLQSAKIHKMCQLLRFFNFPSKSLPNKEFNLHIQTPLTS